MLNSSRLNILTILLFTFVFLLAVAPFHTALAVTKPGWGFGDTNHIHTGPPGQTVRPNRTVIRQRNNTNVVTNVNAQGNTGGNSVSGNTGGVVHVVTGAVSNVISIVVNAGSNIVNFF